MIKITLGPTRFPGRGPVLFNGCDLQYEYRIQGSTVEAVALITGERIAVASTQRELLANIRQWAADISKPAPYVLSNTGELA
jgi:hypothetical protein